jgi:hypothetical protein
MRPGYAAAFDDAREIAHSGLAARLRVVETTSASAEEASSDWTSSSTESCCSSRRSRVTETTTRAGADSEAQLGCLRLDLCAKSVSATNGVCGLAPEDFTVGYFFYGLSLPD